MRILIALIGALAMGPVKAAAGVGQDRPDLAAEHAALLALVPTAAATHVAVRSGPWSAASTWEAGRIPSPGARVHIPGSVVVTVDRELDRAALDWVRVDGTLTFASDEWTALLLETLVVTEKGQLQMGSAERPITANVKARLLFAPRPRRNREGDPFDLAGGLIAQGGVAMHGAPKSAVGLPARPVTQGTRDLDLAEAVHGWRIGDGLLVPGTDAYVVQDELRQIVTVSDDGRSVQLDRPLSYDHSVPKGGSLPVGNLTRNIEVASVDQQPLSARGHVMIMHNPTGTVIDGAAFLHLGRTDTRIAHTQPELDGEGRLKPGTADNTIGRYAVHFHTVSGASADLPPHLFENSVIVDSPKHGLVCHGGHVVATDNVTYQVAGSHFFAENGSEIGAFRRNLAVRSAGSGDRIRSRFTIADHGHGGHGFWTQSAGIAVTDNWAFGHAQGAYVVSGYPVFEQGKEVYFDGRNLGAPAYADERGRVPTGDVNLYFARNVAAGSASGIEIWSHKAHAGHRETSLVEDCVVWNARRHAVFLPYVRNTVLRNLKLYGYGAGNGGIGIAGNSMTENIVIDGLSAEGFSIGVVMPQRGHNAIRNAHLANEFGLQIESATRPGRVTTLENVSFRDPMRASGSTIALVDLNLPANGDLAMLFESDRIYVVDREGRRSRLFYPSQHPASAPFKDGPEPIRGLTSQQIFDRYGVAVGGALAPRGAVRLAGSNGLLAPVQDREAADEGRLAPLPSREVYPFASRHFARGAGARPSARWQFVKAAAGQGPGAVVCEKNGGPAFLLNPPLRSFRIHPDDVEYGYQIGGLSVDRAGEHKAMRAFVTDFPNLHVDDDGFVRVSVKISDSAGNLTPIDIALEVTPETVRRGRNVNYYMQRQYCGDCGFDQLQQEGSRLFEEMLRSK